MTRALLLCRLLLTLCLAWTNLPSTFAAEEIEKEAVQVEQENPPPVQLEPDKPAKAAKKQKPRKRTIVKRSTGNEVVEVGKDVYIAPGETVGELVVIAGNATVDGKVEGDLVVVSGSAKVNGQVERALVTILGPATLGAQAKIGHDVVVVGGPLRMNPAADIGGHQTVVAIGQMVPDFMWLQNWLSKGLFLARPFPPQLKWVWFVAVLFLLVYLAMATVFPRPVRACVDRLEHQPVASFLVGMLMFILLGPLILLLVVSMAGILVIPFLLCALGAAGLLGKVAVYSYAGEQVGRQFQARDLSLPMMLLLGALLFFLIYMVPVLGFAVWGIVTVLGLGAVLMTAFGSLRHEQAPVYAGSVSPDISLGVAVPPVAGLSVVPSAPPLISSTETALWPRVGFWKRFLATSLDFILLCLLIPITGPLFVLIWAGYHIGMWSWKGTTIGGVVLGIKIVRVDGSPIDFAISFVRCLSSFFSGFALFIGFFWAGWDRDRQAWHDKIAGTIVVQVPKSISLI